MRKKRMTNRRGRPLARPPLALLPVVGATRGRPPMHRLPTVGATSGRRLLALPYKLREGIHRLLALPYKLREGIEGRDIVRFNPPPTSPLVLKGEQENGALASSLSVIASEAKQSRLFFRGIATGLVILAPRNDCLISYLLSPLTYLLSKKRATNGRPYALRSKKTPLVPKGEKRGGWYALLPERRVHAVRKRTVGRTKSMIKGKAFS